MTRPDVAGLVAKLNFVMGAYGPGGVSASALCREAALALTSLDERVKAAEALCKIYFDIAAEPLGEDEVRRRRDAALASGERM